MTYKKILITNLFRRIGYIIVFINGLALITIGNYLINDIIKLIIVNIIGVAPFTILLFSII